MTYPGDVEAALAHARDAGWNTERYQAVLGIALHHLDSTVVEVYPEVVVMLADERISWCEDSMTPGEFGIRIIHPGAVYLVCPVCCGSGRFETFSEGTEYADLDYEEASDGGVWGTRDGWDFRGDGASGLTHQSNNCYSRLSLPEWFDLD